MSGRRKKHERKEGENHALHEATHGQFGEEPRPKPTPPLEDERKDAKSSHQAERLKAARKRSRVV